MHDPRPHKVLGSDLIDFRESLRMEKNRRMMKRVSLAIVALAVSAGVAVAGDVAAGETVFKKCMTCHSKLRRNRPKHARPSPQRPERTQVRLGARLQLLGCEQKSRDRLGTKRLSRNTSKIQRRRFRVPKWCFRGLRTRRTPTICGATSSSSDRTARRNKQFSPRFPMLGKWPHQPLGDRSGRPLCRETEKR
jgi:hypothetical protein